MPLDATVIHVGSYCMVAEPVAGTLRQLVERQQGRSLIAYDPNIRLAIEPSVQVWRDTLDWMLPRTNLLKVSDEDLHHLYPDWSAEGFVRYALEGGVQWCGHARRRWRVRGRGQWRLRDDRGRSGTGART